MAGQKKLTIRDIARMAKVSRSTVSLALNDSPRINDQTKAHVLQLIEKVGYRPNAMARGLASDRVGAISIVVPPVGHIFGDAYFSESLSGILDAASKTDCRVSIEPASEAFVSGEIPERLFSERRTDGLLAVGALVTDTYLLDLYKTGRRVVLVNSQLDEIPAIVADNVEGVVAVVNHLVSLGHQDIGYIRGLTVTTTGRQRDEGFLQGLRLTGRPFREDLVANGDFSEESGYRAMDEILQRDAKPTAIFAGNDMMAIGAMRRLKESGMMPGRDIALVGGDDAPLARYVDPSLTTLRQSMYDLGAEATQMLLQWIKTKTPPKQTPMHRTELIVRQSCGAKNSGTKESM